jgi:hypothetical protein
MSNLEDLSMTQKKNRYTIVWKKNKKRGYISRQEVTVIGEDAALHVIKTMVPDKDNYDVYLAF